MLYCSYYQARVVRKQTWLLVALLRSHEHLAFDRTLNKENAVFEFFVPSDREEFFIKIMRYLQHENIIYEFNELPNRFSQTDALF